MGWYNSSWKFRHAVVVNSASVTANQSNIPLHIDLASLPIDFWLNVKSDGSDIRVTTSDGTTEQAVEVVSINTTTKVGRIYFKAGSISSSSNTTFYIYSGNSSASAYAVTDTYGRNAVWSNGYLAVWHLTETPDTGSFANLDSTGNGYNMKAAGTVSQNTSGKFGNCVSFNNGDLFSAANWTPTQPMTNEAWVYVTGGGNQTVHGNGVAGAYGRRNLLMYSGNQTQHTEWGGDVRATGTIATSTWHHVATTKASGGGSGSVTVYNNGSSVSTTQFSAPSTGNGTSNPLKLGRNYSNSEAFYGSIAEARVSSVERSSTWLSTQYNNHNAPNTFYTVGITEHEAATSNWLDTDWSSRVQVPVNKAKIYENLTDFPFYIDLSLLPSGFFTACKSDGSDIRATLGDGLTQIPIEIVTISTGGESGEVHVKHPLLKTTGGDSIFLYCGNAAASLPAASDTYGSQNVWNSNYKLVAHCQEDPNGDVSGAIKDSTSNANHGTPNGSMVTADSVAGKLAGKGLDFDGVNDAIDFGNGASLQITSAITVEAWIKGSSDNQKGFLSKPGAWGFNSDLNVTTPGGSDWSVASATPSSSGNTDLKRGGTAVWNGSWVHVAMTFQSGTVTCYRNGVNDTSNYTDLWTGNSSNIYNSSFNVYMGRNSGSYKPAVGDEYRISAAVRSANWIKSSYENQNDASTFLGTIGSLEESNTAPEISSVTPADNATGVSIGANLVIQFSETIVKGTGNITIKKTSDDSTIETIDVTSGQVTIDDDEATINPSSNLAYSTEFYVLIDAGAFEDSAGLDFAGISSTTEWSFTTEDPDITAPTLSSSTPADNATGVTASANIVLNFNENVVKGTGNITIKKYDDDTTIETIDVTSGIVSISSAQVTINPVSNLPNGTHVYVLIANTCFKDASDNFYAGIASKDTLDFTIADTVAPSLVSSNPEAGAPAIVPDTTITLTFDEDIIAGTGDITIKEYGDDSTFEAIDVTSGQVVITDNEAVITPGSDLDPNTKYYIFIDNTAFVDASSNAYAGIADKDVLSFTTIPIATETLSPASGAVDVAPDTDLELDFNQDVSSNSGNITISQRPNLKIGGDDFSGDIGEILVIREELSDEDRQKIEGYLAWRWFNASNPLITSHPFKYKGPTI